jgi:gliding motility-associated-like protein
MQPFARFFLSAFFACIFLISKTFAQTVTIMPEAGYDTCAPFPLTLRADTTGIGIVEWSDDSKADTLVVNDYGTYSVTLTTLGATVSDDFTISKIDCCHPVLANAFTPNDDGVNDKFGVMLKYCDVQILEFSVYSRWGELMFQALETTDRWDGTTLNGTEAPSDVYVYVTRYKVADEEVEKFEKGGVTLLR